MNKLLPQTRTTDIIEQEAGDELLIYDLQNNKAYTLNETLRNVYKACDGKMTFEDLRSHYNFTDDLIHFAIDELTANNLIEDYKHAHFAGMNRRDVIKKIGIGAVVALPVIVGIFAPTAAHAASSCPDPFTPSGIPNGCRTGGNINDVKTCAGQSDADRTNLCQGFGGIFTSRCASGNAAYAGDCVTTGPDFSSYSCVCTA